MTLDSKMSIDRSKGRQRIWDSMIQTEVFSLVMECMSRPGKVIDLSGISQKAPVYTTVLAALVDSEVTYCDLQGLLTEQDELLFQAPDSAPDNADFILCDASEHIHIQPKLGSLSSPEKSATILLVVADLVSGEAKFELKGPGIKGSTRLEVRGMHIEWFHQRNKWNAEFPLGVDFILCDQRSIVALPRTTNVEVI